MLPESYDFFANAVAWIVERVRVPVLVAPVIAFAGALSFGYRFGCGGAIAGALAGAAIGFAAGWGFERLLQRRAPSSPERARPQRARRHVPSIAPVGLEEGDTIAPPAIEIDPNAPLDEKIAGLDALAGDERALELARALAKTHPRDARPLRLEARLLRSLEREGEAALVDDEAAQIEALIRAPHRSERR
jgi:hypothetical protein